MPESTEKNNGHWFASMSNTFKVDLEIVELAEVKDCEISQLQLWRQSVCAPFLVWVAACNCDTVERKKHLLKHVADLIDDSLQQFNADKIFREISAPRYLGTKSVEPYQSFGHDALFVQRVGESLRHFNFASEYLHLNDPIFIRRFPYAISMAVDSCESFCTAANQNVNDLPCFFIYPLESTVRKFLHHDKNLGICP